MSVAAKLRRNPGIARSIFGGAFVMLRRHAVLCFFGFLLLCAYLRDPFYAAEERINLVSGRMIEVENIGRLAPFPKERSSFKFTHMTGMFHDVRRVSFEASPDIVSKWLKESPGVQEGKKMQTEASVYYILKTLRFHGWIDVYDGGSHVVLEVGLMGI